MIKAADVKTAVKLSALIGQDIALKRQGAEMVGICPFHEDGNASLNVNDAKQVYLCRACGATGDHYDYLRERHGMDINAAKEHLVGGKQALTVFQPVQRVVDAVEDDKGLERVDATHAPLLQAGVPFRAWSPKSSNYVTITADMVHPYRDISGKLLGYTIRTDKAKGMPLQYCQRTDAPDAAPEWTCTGFPDNNRALYSIEHLPASGRVVVVEGEKCVDALRGEGICAVSWLGGAQAMARSDWSALQGYDVVCWADADDAGHKAMHGDGKKKGVVQLLDGIAASVKVIVPPAGKPKGWDVADAIDEFMEILPLIDSAGEVYREPEPAPEPIISSEISPANPPATAKVKAEKSNSKFANNPFFRCLGHDQGKYYFIPKSGGQVREYTAASLSKTHALYELAKPDWWRKNYCNDDVPNFKSCLDFAMYELIDYQNKIGIFSQGKTRGIGWWKDGKDMVLHLGNRLMVDGEIMELGDYHGTGIYEHLYTVKEDMANPLDLEECAEFLNLLTMFPFTDQRHEIFYAGWIVTAFISGALAWRPHIWVTGEAGSGKSCLINVIMAKILGDFGLHFTGATTMPGIERSLEINSVAVSIDESEGDGKQADARILQILSMLRSASSTGESQKIRKASGSSNSFVERIIRSQFCLSSIDKIALVPADLQRITPISVSKEHFTHDYDGVVMPACLDTLTPEFCQRFAGRALNSREEISRAIPIWKAALRPHIQHDRTELQLGTLLAGYWTLVSDDAITADDAAAFVAQYGWSDMKQNAAENTDERGFFEALLAAQIRFMDDGKITRQESVGYLIRAAQEGLSLEDIPMSYERAQAVLRENGINITGTDFGAVHFAKSSVEIRRLLFNTKWANGYQSTLERVPGCWKGANSTVRRVCGRDQRVITIPNFWQYVNKFMEQ